MDAQYQPANALMVRRHAAYNQSCGASPKRGMVYIFVLFFHTSSNLRHLTADDRLLMLFRGSERVTGVRPQVRLPATIDVLRRLENQSPQKHSS